MFRIKLITVCFALLSSFNVFAGGEEARSSCSSDQIKAFMNTKLSKYNVVEFVDTSYDIDGFIKRSLGQKYLDNSTYLNKCEFQVNNTLGKKIFHIGFIQIKYSNKDLLQKNYTKLKDGFLEGTKILTKYKTVISDSGLKVWYSETFLDNYAKEFLAEVK